MNKIKYNEHENTTIPYTINGEGSLGILFIHGFLDEGAIWSQVIDDLHYHDLATVTLDLPGMGALNKLEGPFSLRILADAVIRVVDELNMPIMLVGQSMGSQIAELVAHSRSERVKGLVLLTPIPLKGLPMPKEIVERMCNPNRTADMQRNSKKQIAPNICSDTLEAMVKASMKVKGKNLRSLFEAWSEGDAAGNKPCPGIFPVLVIGGEKDPFSTPALIKEDVIPRFALAESIVLPGVSHWPHAEIPQVIAKKLDNFIRKTIQHRE